MIGNGAINNNATFDFVNDLVDSTATTLQNNIDEKVDKSGNAWVTSKSTNGKNWYRIWSDGFKEQGGLTSVASGSQKVTLNTAFSNTNYTILGTSNNNGNVVNVTNAQKTNTTFEIDYSGSTSGYCFWYACGY